MEQATTYFTRRARQERDCAGAAGSAQARGAHLELAMRFVKKAIEPALWRHWTEQKPCSSDDLALALSDAYALPRDPAFEELLEAI